MIVRFELDITVDGVPYKSGDEVSADSIPAGCLEALQRQCRVTTADAQTPLRTPAAPPAIQAVAEPDPKQKKK